MNICSVEAKSEAKQSPTDTLAARSKQVVAAADELLSVLQHTHERYFGVQPRPDAPEVRADKKEPGGAITNAISQMEVTSELLRRAFNLLRDF